MMVPFHISRWGGRLRHRLAEETGGVLVEFAVVISLFFFLFFAILDFGRMVFTVTMAEKAVYLAARTAVVRPAACPGVPDRHARGATPPNTTPPRFGTSCRVGITVCEAVATVSCAGSTSNATANEIWNRIDDLLPPGTPITVLQFSYAFDSNLGFLGGPYTPVVTVDLNLPPFQFVSPLGSLANAAGANNSTLGSPSVYPTFSVSLPAEDLNLGGAG